MFTLVLHRKVFRRHMAQVRAERAERLASRSEDDKDDDSTEDDAVLEPEKRRNPFHDKAPDGTGSTLMSYGSPPERPMSDEFGPRAEIS